MELTAFNCHQALADGIRMVLNHGVETSSRNGRVLAIQEPVTIKYLNPQDRVLLSPTRDANPFFHMAEAMWMLAGRNDLAPVEAYVSTFGQYSDDGITLHGAYGHRWINHFGIDQLTELVTELRTSGSRRAVLGMWDPRADLPKLRTGGKDVPCNTHAYFAIRTDGKLDMTVCNRSNDAIFGCFGANLVHFSILQEYLASVLGVPVGKYCQVTNNLHIYLDVVGTEKLEKIISECDILAAGGPRISGSMDVLGDSALVMSEIWHTRRAGTQPSASDFDRIPDPAWRMACLEWVERRRK